MGPDDVTGSLGCLSPAAPTQHPCWSAQGPRLPRALPGLAHGRPTGNEPAHLVLRTAEELIVQRDVVKLCRGARMLCVHNTRGCPRIY